MLTLDDDILIEDISDDNDEDDNQFNMLTMTSQKVKTIIGLIVTFFLTFRVIYNVSDHAILLLLRFTKYLIHKVGTTFAISQLCKDDIQFPKTIHGCYSFLKQNKSPCTEFIACPSCHMLYDQSILVSSTRTQIPKCSFVEFPNHPQQRFRQPCNATLLNVILKKQKCI